MKRAKPSPKHDQSAIIARIAGIREAANLLIEKELQARGLTGIVPAHGSVLNFLFRQQEPVPIKSLVSRIGRVKSTVTGIVNTLERHGYLYKQGCDQDARSVRIGLTDKGMALKCDFEEISETVLGRVYGDMPENDRQRLMELLAIVEGNLKG
ncbi:MarR family winged helix-turn-helix transcriptional regulator [Geobacter grbiciae]|uniref:MarR family winged helix-turn-helix transcriptional regulator n=1 Tax=Geobacter grbiciae TaxID=155042 RepID=UPI001C02CFFA|nr:MarR family transcriptional regulator [Geobacter grbiciae]MBT1077018.1 winged helix DNA-binding protein [Geobacter grbiciae]